MQRISVKEVKKDDNRLREDPNIVFRKLYHQDVNEKDKKENDSHFVQEISYDKWPQNIMLIISPSKNDEDKFKLQAFDRAQNAVLGNSKITRDELYAMHESKALNKYPVFLSPELDYASRAFFSGQAPGEVFDNQALVLYKRLSHLTYSESKMDIKTLVVNSLTKVEESPKVLIKVVSGLQLRTPICVKNNAGNQENQNLTHFAMSIKSNKKSDPGMHVVMQVGQDLEPQKHTDLKKPPTDLLKNRENLFDMNTENKITKLCTNNQSSNDMTIGPKQPSQENREQIVNKMQEANTTTMKHREDKTQEKKYGNKRTKLYTNNQSSNEMTMGPKISSQEKRDQIVNKMQKANKTTMKRSEDKTQEKKYQSTKKEVERKTKSVLKVEGNVNKTQIKRQVGQTAAKTIIKKRSLNEKNKLQAGRKELKKEEVKKVSQQRKEIKVQSIKNTKLDKEKLNKSPKKKLKKAGTDNKELIKMKEGSENQKGIGGMTDMIQRSLQDGQGTSEEFILQTNRKEIKPIKCKPPSRKVYTIFQNSTFVKEESSSQIKVDDVPERILTVLQSSKTDEKKTGQDYLKENVDQTPMIISNFNSDSGSTHTNENIMGNKALNDHKELKEQIKYQKVMEEKTLSHKEGNKDVDEILKSSRNLKAEGNSSSEGCIEKSTVNSDRLEILKSSLNLQAEGKISSESLTEILKGVSERFLSIYMPNRFQEVESESDDQQEIINDNNKLQNDIIEFKKVPGYISEEMAEEETEKLLELPIICNEIKKVRNKTAIEDQLKEIVGSSQNSFAEYSDYENEKGNYSREELTKLYSETMSQDDWCIDKLEFQYSEELTETANINEDQATCLAMKKLDKDTICLKEKRRCVDESETSSIQSIQADFTKCKRLADDITDQEDKEEDMDKTLTTCINSKVVKKKVLKSQSKRVRILKSGKPQETLSVENDNDKQKNKEKKSKLKSGKPQQIPSKIPESKAKSDDKSKDMSTLVTSASPTSGTKNTILSRIVKEQGHSSAKSTESSVTDASSSSVRKRAVPSKMVKRKYLKSQSKRVQKLKLGKPQETLSEEDNNDKQKNKEKNSKLKSGKPQQTPSKIPESKAKSDDKSKDMSTSVTSASSSSGTTKSILLRIVKEQGHSSNKSPESSVTDESSSSVSKKAVPSRNVKKQIHSIVKSPVSSVTDTSSSCVNNNMECIKLVHFAIKEEPEIQSSEEETINRKGVIVPKIHNDDIEIIRPPIELNYSDSSIQEDFKNCYPENDVQYVTSSILKKNSSEFEKLTKLVARPPDRVTIPSEVLTSCGVRLRQQIGENRNKTVSLSTLLDEINFREIPSNSHLFKFFCLANKHSFKIYVRPEIVFPGYQMVPRLRLECFLHNNRFISSVALLPEQFNLFVSMFSKITPEHIEDAFHLTRLPKWLVKALKRFFNAIHLLFVYDIMAEIAYEFDQDPATMSLDTP